MSRRRPAPGLSRTVRMSGVAAAALALFCGCRQPEPLTFRFHLSEAPSTLDPAQASDVYSMGVIDRLFDGLMRLDRVRNVPEPELAESVSVSDDGRLYTFRLLPEARFHNGRTIRAADFKSSWERLLAAGNDSPQSYLFEPIEGAGAFRAGLAPSVAGIKAEGDVLRVRLAEPYAPFLYHMADVSASVVPEEEVSERGEDFGRNPVGSGPYRFVESVRNQRIVLEAFDGHPRHRPRVRRLIFQVIPGEREALSQFREGRLDVVTQIPPGSLLSLQGSFPAELRTSPGSDWQGFCFRCDRQPFDDVRVRRAFALAVDRDALVRELGALQHTASVGFLPPTVPGHDSATLTSGHDLGRARALLAAAGYPEGASFPRLSYLTRGGELNQRVAELLSAAVAELGVEMDYLTMDFNAELQARDEGRFALFRQGWLGDFPDPEPYFRPLFHSLGHYNWAAYANPEVDRLLDTARAGPDAVARRALYRQAEALIIRDAPCVSLFHQTEAILLQSRWRDLPVGYLPEALEIERAGLTEGGS